MRYPKYLPQNGTIGFVAPSFGCNIEPYRSGFLAALDRFQQDGYQVDLGPNCFEGKGIGISNTPEACGSELTDYYCTDQNDALISCGGGELMCEILDHVDFGRVSAAEPKWFMGYSDNTNFTFLLTTLCDVASIYGPCAKTFGMSPRHPSVQDAEDVLTGKKQVVSGYRYWEKEELEDASATAPYHTTEPSALHSYPEKHVKFSGRLVGGCMDCLINLVGTSYDGVKSFADQYKDDGIIWFLESCDLNVMGIRRALWQMAHAGWFRHVKGFLIGRPGCYGQEAFGMDQYQAVLGVLEQYHVPVVMDVDIGHLPPQMPIICGAMADVTVKGNDITVAMELK